MESIFIQAPDFGKRRVGGFLSAGYFVFSRFTTFLGPSNFLIIFEYIL